MKVVIAGAGEVGTHLARMLSSEDHDIVLLDDSPEKLNKLSVEVDLMTVAGSDRKSVVEGKSVDIGGRPLI